MSDLSGFLISTNVDPGWVNSRKVHWGPDEQPKPAAPIGVPSTMRTLPHPAISKNKVPRES